MNIFCRYTMPVDPPWQPDWQKTPEIYLDCGETSRIARAPFGAPIPDGAVEYAEERDPAVRPELVDRALSELRAIAADARHGDDPFSRARTAERILAAGKKGVMRVLREQAGVPHAFAKVAPLSVATPDEAAGMHTHAVTLWDSRCTAAVIRAAEQGGYHSWIGVGSRMVGRRHARTAKHALAHAIRDSRDMREQVMQSVLAVLVGWSGSTPFLRGTIDTVATEIPLYVRRGPVSCMDMPQLSAARWGTSWDLPTWAVVCMRTGLPEIREDAVVWDDDESRRAARKRQLDGQRRAEASARLAVQHMSRHPLIQQIADGDRLRPCTIEHQKGHHVKIMGPVRLSVGGTDGQALVRVMGRREWWPLATMLTQTEEE